MPEKDPATYSMMTYAWVCGLSAWGAITSVIRRATSEMSWKKKLQFIAAEVTISTFAGMVTFFLCEAAAIDKMLSAAMIAVSGHMGARAIILTEKMVVKFFGSRNL